eukprot:164934-Alexandrium_andersonii.AAC.1
MSEKAVCERPQSLRHAFSEDSLRAGMHDGHERDDAAGLDAAGGSLPSSLPSLAPAGPNQLTRGCSGA